MLALYAWCVLRDHREVLTRSSLLFILVYYSSKYPLKNDYYENCSDGHLLAHMLIALCCLPPCPPTQSYDININNFVSYFGSALNSKEHKRKMAVGYFIE